MHERYFIHCVPACLAFVLVAIPAVAHDAYLSGPYSHKNVSATITKIDSGLMYLDIEGSSGGKVSPRSVSVKKADRMGLH